MSSSKDRDDEQADEQASGVQRTLGLRPWLEAALDDELDLPSKLGKPTIALDDDAAESGEADAERDAVTPKRAQG